MNKFIKKILKEGYGNTDKEQVLKAITEIRSKGYQNPFNPREIVINNKVGLEISFFDGALWISSITSYEKGGGRLGMQIVLDTADKYKVIIRLSPEPFGKKTLNRSQLISWYKRLGFKKINQGYERVPNTKLKESQVINKRLPLNLLKTLIDWITNGGYHKKIGAILKRYSYLFPEESKQAANYIFRIITVKKGNRINFKAGIRSWTNSERNAMKFGEGKDYFTGYYDTYILKLPVEKNRIICNLSLLEKTEVFQKSIQYYKKKGELENSVLDSLSYEDEIIYDQPNITEQDVYLKMVDENGIKKWI